MSYVVTISGDYNDSDIILGSTSSSITENLTNNLNTDIPRPIGSYTGISEKSYLKDHSVPADLSNLPFVSSFFFYPNTNTASMRILHNGMTYEGVDYNFYNGLDASNNNDNFVNYYFEKMDFSINKVLGEDYIYLIDFEESTFSPNWFKTANNSILIKKLYYNSLSNIVYFNNVNSQEENSTEFYIRDDSGNIIVDEGAKNYSNMKFYPGESYTLVDIWKQNISHNTLENNSLTLESSMNVLDNFIGDQFGFHLDKNLNGGVPMVNSILPISDDDLTLTNFKFVSDPSNISGIGGHILSTTGNNNSLNFNTFLKFENKATFNLTKNGVSLASSYNNKLYISDLFNEKSFGFGSSINLFTLGDWWGSMFQFHIAKDLSDNFIFKLGGGSINTDGDYSHWSTINNEYVYNYNKYFMSSESLLYNDFSNSTYNVTTPFSDPSKNIYSLHVDKKLLINMSRNFYIDVNENMELFDPMNTLLKGSNYPFFGSMNFDISVNKDVSINDVSGFAFALNNLELFDSMGNLQAYSDVSFNDDLNVMCFGSTTGSDFNFTGILYIMGYVTDVSSQLHRFNFAATGSINGNYDFSNQELNGKQNLYLNIIANESSKTSFFNNRTLLVSWDTTKPNVPKYVSLLPELVGNKISIYNKEIVMQI